MSKARVNDKIFFIVIVNFNVSQNEGMKQIKVEIPKCFYIEVKCSCGSDSSDSLGDVGMFNSMYLFNQES